jgi:hypothetical protein
LKKGICTATDVERLIAEVEQLSPEQQRSLYKVLEEKIATATSPRAMTEEAFLQNLFNQGRISHIPQRPPTARQRSAPVKIAGKPLSETIVEERR